MVCLPKKIDLQNLRFLTCIAHCYYKACFNINDFASYVNILTTKLLEQSYTRSKIITKISAFVKKRKLAKYSSNLMEISNIIMKAIPDNVKTIGRP